MRFAICYLGLVFTANACCAQMYTVTDLATLGGSQSFAYAMNGSGDIVGYSWMMGDAAGHFFLYTKGQMSDLHRLNSNDLITTTMDINNAGQIAGGLVVGGVYVPAFLNSKNGDLTLVPSLGGVNSYGFSGVATAINGAGEVAGYSYIDAITRHAFLYSKGTTTDIGSFGGYSEALGINDEGVVVGFASEAYNGVAHAFIYRKGVMKRIGPDTESYARRIDNMGQVVGEFLRKDRNEFHPFLYSAGKFTDLGFSGGATGIDEYGQVVGWSPYSPSGRAFLYSGGVMHDLNTLIASDSGCALLWPEPVMINNAGQIVAGRNCNGEWHAVLLTPVYRAFVQPPIKSDGTSVFSAKRGVVPIDFALTRYNLSTCSLLPATIAITRTGEVHAPVDERTSSLPANSGSNFRFNSCHYVYNLAASSLRVGTYRVDIRISGISVGHAVFALR